MSLISIIAKGLRIGKILKGNIQDFIVVDMWHVLQRWLEYWWTTLSIPHVQESIHTSTATHAILDEQNLNMTFKNCSQHPHWKKKTQNISKYLYIFKIQKWYLLLKIHITEIFEFALQEMNSTLDPKRFVLKFVMWSYLAVGLTSSETFFRWGACR